MARIVGRTPEVMVKVTGRTRGITHLKAHFDYLTRNGRIVAGTQAGELIGDWASLRELHDEWLLSNAAEARGRNTPQSAQSVGIILSMPPGAPRDRVDDAARTWARETFAEKHDWIMVRHDDRDHSHVHVSVRAVGITGRRLSPGPADLQSWRDDAMPIGPTKLREPTRADLVHAISHAMLYSRGIKRNHDWDQINAKVAAEKLIDGLAAGNYHILQAPPSKGQAEADGIRERARAKLTE